MTTLVRTISFNIVCIVHTIDDDVSVCVCVHVHTRSILNFTYTIDINHTKKYIIQRYQ